MNYCYFQVMWVITSIFGCLFGLVLLFLTMYFSKYNDSLID